MQQVYEKLDTITKKKQRENLENFKDQAFLSRKLVTINTQSAGILGYGQIQSHRPRSVKKLTELFKNLEFRQLQQAFPEQADLSSKDYQAIMDLAACKS
jgi:DNA polymerase-1